MKIPLLSPMTACLALTVVTSALRASDFYVNGATGADRPDHGSAPTTPWRTIGYALMRIATAPSAPHVLYVEGGQTYGWATNGELFPLFPPRRVAIVGRGAVRPILGVAAGETAVRFDDSNGYDAATSRLQNLGIHGGAKGVAMEPPVGNYYGITYLDCHFRGQSVAGLWCNANLHNSLLFPEVRDCTFEQCYRGIDYALTAHAVPGNLQVEGCTFSNCTDWCIASYAQWRDSNNPVRVNRCSFFDSRGGVSIDNGSTGLSAPTSVSDCRFVRCADAGVRIHASNDNQNFVDVDRCAFVDSGDAIRFDMTQYYLISRLLRIRDNLVTRCSAGFVGRWSQGPPGPDHLVLGSNWFERCGIAVSITSATPLVITSLRDRVIGCRLGMQFTNVPTGSIRIDSGMFCSCVGTSSAPTIGVLHFDVGATVQCAGLTFADNTGHALQVNRSGGTTLTHCAFSNRGNDLFAPSPVIASYCCFHGQRVPGTGNLDFVDPRFQRPSYKLLPGSPCIDAGDPATTLAAVDYEGDPRTVGPRPDIGADEFTPAGTVRVYGLPGFGRLGFAPSIGSSNTSLRLGGSLAVSLSGARNANGQTAIAAHLMLGRTEFLDVLPRSLAALGAPDSFLWLEPLLVLPPVAVDTTGAAMLTLAVPNTPVLTGEAMTFQWLVQRPDANALGLVGTQALRATFGN